MREGGVLCEGGRCVMWVREEVCDVREGGVLCEGGGV